MENKLARIISEILNGFLGMFLPILLVTWLQDISLIHKIIISLYYPLMTTIPYLLMRKSGHVSDHDFTDRKERPPYFITMTTIYALGFLYIAFLNNIQMFNVSLVLFVITSIFTVVTFFWKISGHMTYIVYLLITIIYLFPTTPFIYLILLIIPVLAWSRVELKKHTYAQTIAGTILSLLSGILIYHILW